MDQSVRGPEKKEKEKEKEKEENNCGKLLTCRLRRARQKKVHWYNVMYTQTIIIQAEL